MFSRRSSSPNYQVQGVWTTEVCSGMVGARAELPGDIVSGGAYPRHTTLQKQVSHVEQPIPQGGKAFQETVYHGLIG